MVDLVDWAAWRGMHIAGRRTRWPAHDHRACGARGDEFCSHPPRTNSPNRPNYAATAEHNRRRAGIDHGSARHRPVAGGRGGGLETD